MARDLSPKQLAEFYRRFLIEAGFPEDMAITEASRRLPKTIKHKKASKGKKADRAAKLRAARRRAAARKAANIRWARYRTRKKKARAAALKGWETRRKNAKERARQEAIAKGEKKPRTWKERIEKILNNAKLRDSDVVRVVRNADGSVDGELYVPVTNATAYNSLLLVEENMDLLPDNVWVGFVLYFNTKVKLVTPTLARADKRTGRPRPVSKRKIELGGSTLSTPYYRSDAEGYSFLKAREAVSYMIDDIQESDKVGAVTGFAVRLYWNKGKKPS